MTSQRTYPNFISIGIGLSSTMFIVWFGLNMIFSVLGIQIPFFLRANETAFQSDIEGLIGVFVMGLIFVLLGLYGLWALSEGWTNISVNEQQITIIRPLKGKWKSLKLEEVQGFSTSRHYIGGGWAKSDAWWCSDSFIVYTLNDEPFEIIKLYNYGYEKIVKSISEIGVKEFEFEPFETHGFLIKHRTFRHRN